MKGFAEGIIVSLCSQYLAPNLMLDDKSLVSQ